MGIIVGSLSGQNWHRQVRQRGLGSQEAFAYLFAKTAVIGKTFGFSPLAIDCAGALLGADQRARDETKARLRENDMIAVVGLGGISLANDAELRRLSLQRIAKQLEVAADFGSHTATFYFHHHGRVTREGQFRYAVEMVREVGRMAGELGLRICTENYDYFTSDELIRICQETGLDNVGIQSDSGNWLILGEDPVAATARCLPYTFNAHVRDYVLENGAYNGVALGVGLIDFGRILPLLAQAGAERDIVFSVEVDTDDRDEDECAQVSFAYLKEWLVANGHTKYLRESTNA
jgi:sugar phosphate isomerase/epimerase